MMVNVNSEALKLVLHLAEEEVARRKDARDNLQSLNCDGLEVDLSGLNFRIETEETAIWMLHRELSKVQS
jgi:hypothetical protein